MVNEITVPSGSAPVSADMGMAPSAAFKVAFVLSSVVGGVDELVSGMIKDAGVASTAPWLSVAVKLNTALPVAPVAGSNCNDAICAGVNTWPCTTGTPLKNNTPCNGLGKAVMV